MLKYKCLINQIFVDGEFRLVPIRFEDSLKIMQWRNEQIYHLRQNKPLTIEDQNYYFDNVVTKLFDQDKPNQILFSFLKGNVCFGYGGLVHINWIDKNAEISFIMNTELENEYFSVNWIIYLGLIEKVAFNELGLNKIYVYIFDLRPHLYQTLSKAMYFEDARLNEHCFFQGKFIDVVIYSKISNEKK
jgi:hypothetical protein